MVSPMIQNASRALEVLLEWVVICLMVVLTVVVVVAVIFRFLGNSFSWYDEVASVLLAWITYYGAGLAALKRKHIGFDGVLLAMPMPARLYAAWLAEIITIGFFVLMAWAGLQVLAVLEGMTLTALTWVPVQLTQSVIPIGAALFIIGSLLSFPGYLQMVRQGESAEHAEIEAEIAEAEKTFGAGRER
ncbi:MAG: TRAP transporter small permease subunit [Pseudomonadota bacterium]